MKIIDVQQGTNEWHALRSKRLTASEAPAMMGISKYQTRTQLLDQKTTGLTPDVDEYQQRIFDKGHTSEAAARPIAEGIIGEDLYPVTCEDDEGRLLASMDGLTMLEDVGFEHKLWNEKLAEQVKAGNLEPHYTVQMDQQMLVSGAEKILFMCSDGSEENCAWMWYERNEKAIKALLAGWEQFEKDLANHKPAEAEQPKAEGKAPDALPSLVVRATGVVESSNLREFEEAARTTLATIKTKLETDQDFADAEKNVKFCKDVESRLDSTKENVLGQMQTVDEAVRAIDSIREETRQVRLKLEKAVKTEKDARKQEIVLTSKQDFDTFVRGLDVGQYMPAQIPDFAGAIKGKKTIASMKSACDDLMAQSKIEVNEQAGIVRGNLKQIDEHAADYRFLFNDLNMIVSKPADDFAAIVKARIADYQAEQAKKEAEQKAREEAATKKEPANPLKDSPEISYRAPDPAERPSAKPESMPNPNDMVQVLADHYGVSFQKAASWLASVEWRVAA